MTTTGACHRAAELADEGTVGTGVVVPEMVAGCRLPWRDMALLPSLFPLEEAGLAEGDIMHMAQEESVVLWVEPVVVPCVARGMSPRVVGTYRSTEAEEEQVGPGPLLAALAEVVLRVVAVVDVVVSGLGIFPVAVGIVGTAFAAPVAVLVAVIHAAAAAPAALAALTAAAAQAPSAGVAVATVLVAAVRWGRGTANALAPSPGPRAATRAAGVSAAAPDAVLVAVTAEVAARVEPDKARAGADLHHTVLCMRMEAIRLQFRPVGLGLFLRRIQTSTHWPCEMRCGCI